MAFDAGSIFVRLGLNTDEFVKGIDRAKANLVTWRDETNKGTMDLASWAAAFGQSVAPIAVAGYTIDNLTKNAASFGKSIKDNARDLGLTIKEYQQWRHAAIAAGSSAEEITGTLRMMSIRLKETSTGSSDAIKYLNAMGIQTKDSAGNMRSMSEVLRDVLPALNKLPEGFERNQAAMAIFGRSFNNIADLANLTESELQDLLDQAPVFSDDKIQKMDDYAVKLALVNEQFELMTADLGEDLIPLAEDFLSIIEDLNPVISGFAGFLHESFTGVELMVKALGVMSAAGQYGTASQEYIKAAGEFKNYYVSETEERAGTPGKSKYNAADLIAKINAGTPLTASEKAWAREYEPSMPIPKSTSHVTIPDDKKKKEGEMTPFQITEMQLNYEKMTKYTIPDQQKEIKDLTKEYNLMGDQGSDAAKKIKQKIAEINLEISKNKNQVAEWADKLKTAGADVAATGNATYNTMFAKELHAGGVGPDWGGFSELGTKSLAELEEIAAGKVAGKTSMNWKEKAADYAKRMKKSSPGAGTAGTTGKTEKKEAAAPGSPEQTKEITKELDEQMKSYTSFYQNLQTLTTNSYAAIEAVSLQHHTAMTELARIADQMMLDSWAQTVNWINSNIAYAQQITVVDGVPNASPMSIPKAVPPTIEPTKFGGAGGMGGGNGGKNKEGGTTIDAGSWTVEEIAAAIRANPDVTMYDSQGNVIHQGKSGGGNTYNTTINQTVNESGDANKTLRKTEQAVDRAMGDKYISNEVYY